jgi:hypothetical protein
MKVIQFTPKPMNSISKNRKENHFYSEYAAIVYEDGKYRTPITLRLYLTNSVAYAVLWVDVGDVYTGGSGRAGGYGYHRPSQAVEYAVKDAGFTLSEDIGGRGDEAIIEALKAICTDIGFENVHIHKSNP